MQIYLLPTGHDIDGSILTNRTFRVETTEPVTVHQFNPLNSDAVYTNDASLLLPAHVGGEEYVVMSWRLRTWGLTTLRGFATVIATQEGTTHVTVTAATGVSAGPGVPSMSVGQSQIFTLEQGQILNLEAKGVQGDDLTGTHIMADQKVNVFGGHECANIQVSWERCDHIEQQLFPVQAWGTEYIADPFYPRNALHKDTWRILAGDDNVSVTMEPPIVDPFNLNLGDWIEFDSNKSFSVKGTGKILVGHYLQSCNYPGYTYFCSDTGGSLGIGDPAFTLAVPVTQYLEEYVFLTPEDYAQDYVNIVSQQATSITLDGVPVTDAKHGVGQSGWTLIQKSLTPGVHSLSADGPVALTAYGYGCHVSYAYPGGLKLEAD